MKKAQPPLELPRRSAGFTILELMIAVAVLGILVGIGVPAFTNIIRQNRLASQTNDLLTASAIARSEAVKRGLPVTMCSANVELNACAEDDDQWSNGWLVFTDDIGTRGELDPADADPDTPDDAVVQVWPASTPQRIAVRNDTRRFVSYRGDGGTNLVPGTETVFEVVPENCVDPAGARRVTVSASGRAGSIRIDCPN